MYLSLHRSFCLKALARFSNKFSYIYTLLLIITRRSHNLELPSKVNVLVNGLKLLLSR